MTVFSFLGLGYEGMPESFQQEAKLNIILRWWGCIKYANSSMCPLSRPFLFFGGVGGIYKLFEELMHD